jgi:hypothetical protein
MEELPKAELSVSFLCGGEQKPLKNVQFWSRSRKAKFQPQEYIEYFED